MLFCGKPCKSNKKYFPRKEIDFKLLSQKYRFSMQELVMYRQRYERMSRGPGFVLQDFRENMGLLGMRSTRIITDRIFAVMNRSKNGVVSLEEYLDYMDILMHGNQEEKASQSFKLLANCKKDTVSYADFSS